MTVYTFKTTPFRHQYLAVKRALQQGYIGLLWEPGTGKSKAIVDWSCALTMIEGPQRILIVCPLSVVGVWEDEYAKHAPIPYSLRTLGRKDNLLTWDACDLQVLVTNYDIAWRRPEMVADFDPTMVVADESHRIKKPSTRRSRYLRRLSSVPHRAILTGTPTPKSYMDIYSQWVFLNDERFGRNFNRFKDRYVRFGGFQNRQVRGYANVAELKEKIDADASIATKDDCLDLPDRTYQRVPVILEDEAWDAYRKMAYELFLELQDGDVSDAANVAVKILRLQQITGGWIKSDEGNIYQVSEAKLRACQSRLEDLWDGDERVVVFARFLPEVGAIAESGIRSRVPTYVLSGATRPEDRDNFRRRFQAEAGPSVFVAQIQTGGLGITLHSSAEVIFYSVTHALDDYIQACDRVHRIGQTRKVRYQHLVASNTIDGDIYANLRGKKNLMDIIMNNPKVLASSLARNLGLTGESA